MTSRTVTMIITALLLAFTGGYAIGLAGQMMNIPHPLTVVLCFMYGFFVVPKLAEKLTYGEEKE